MLTNDQPEPEGHMESHKLAELRDYYDNHDTADEMSGGAWETEVDPDPMVTTSLRLPKHVLDWVRAQAEARHMKPTALLRAWIEERFAGEEPTVTERLSRLEHAVFPGHDPAAR